MYTAQGRGWGERQILRGKLRCVAQKIGGKPGACGLLKFKRRKGSRKRKKAGQGIK